MPSTVRQFPWLLQACPVLPILAGSMRMAPSILSVTSDPGFGRRPTEGAAKTALLLAHTLRINVFLVLEAFQFRGGGTGANRTLGRIAATALMAGTVSGLSPVGFVQGAVEDGMPVVVARNLVGATLVFAVTRSFFSAHCGQEQTHRAWIICGCALATVPGIRENRILSSVLFGAETETISPARSPRSTAIYLGFAERIVRPPAFRIRFSRVAT